MVSLDEACAKMPIGKSNDYMYNHRVVTLLAEDTVVMKGLLWYV